MRRKTTQVHTIAYILGICWKTALRIVPTAESDGQKGMGIMNMHDSKA